MDTTYDIPSIDNTPLVTVKKSKKRDISERANYVTYNLNGTPYVPHYVIPDCYIPPGYTFSTGLTDDYGCRFFSYDKTKERTAKQLERAGAIKVVENLWYRSNYQELK